MEIEGFGVKDIMLVLQEKTIENYIQTQLQEDIAYDQLSFKEYIDPFTGKKINK